MLIGGVIVGLFVAFTLGFWIREEGPFANDKDDLSSHIAPRDDAFVFALNGQLEGDKVSIEYRSKFNESLDVLLLDDANYRLYSQGSPFDYISEGSKLNAKSFKTTWIVDDSDNYYWVVDNTVRPAGGAYVNDDVPFKAKVDK